MDRHYKGIDFNYHINRHRGIIKVFTQNINSQTYLDEELRFPATRTFQTAHGTPDGEYEIHSEFVDLITREEFWH